LTARVEHSASDYQVMHCKKLADLQVSVSHLYLKSLLQVTSSKFWSGIYISQN